MVVPSMLSGSCGLSAGVMSEYKPVRGNMMTRWAGHIDPEKVLPEYPRPQMVRSDWCNLNGLWDYAIVDKNQPLPGQFQGKILVPFAAESALSGVGKNVGEKNKLWYRRTFFVPEAWIGKTLLLHCGAVDWDCDVFVNGTLLGNHTGGYDPFSVDSTGALKATGPHELVVSVWDPTNKGRQPVGKQCDHPHGIWYTPVTGIWQTIWLEPVPMPYIDNLAIIPDVDNQKVTVVVEVKGEPDGLSYTADARAPGFSASAASAKNKLVLDITDQKLWSPDSPFLYDLKVQIKQGDTVIDEVGSYFGMRKISLARDDKGIMRIMLNNRFLFQYGLLDQGWWPDGLYTAPSDEALKSDVEFLKNSGMNMLRKHGKVEPARLYYWCDTLGILVWQDMPGGDYNTVFKRRTPESAARFEKEWKSIIRALYNHPSIVMWVPFNEGWGQFDTARIVTMTRDADPTRLVNNASGWTDNGVGDVKDIHAYPGPEMPKVEEKRAVVLGEFGGLGLPVAGHTWQEEKNWGYRSCKNSQELTAAYGELMNKLRPLIARGLSAAVYTQTTDVESEVNGLMTYDREMIKMDAGYLKTRHTRLYQQSTNSETDFGIQS
jgi:beta-galactosidase/beta-glucuronidase